DQPVVAPADRLDRFPNLLRRQRSDGGSVRPGRHVNHLPTTSAPARGERATPFLIRNRHSPWPHGRFGVSSFGAPSLSRLLRIASIWRRSPSELAITWRLTPTISSDRFRPYFTSFGGLFGFLGLSDVLSNQASSFTTVPFCKVSGLAN